MKKYSFILLIIVLIVSGCKSDKEKVARTEYERLEHEWSLTMQRDPSLAISKQWVERFWEFRNQHIGTSSSTTATIKVFELSHKILDFSGIETKYRELSIDEDALANLLEIMRIVAPFNDESAEWRRIVEKTSNVHVRIAAIFRLASYYCQYNQYENCSSLLDTLALRYNITDTDSIYGNDISKMRVTIHTLSVGNILPGFRATDISGKVINSKEFKGKIVLMFFYGPGCGSCMKMLPTLNHLYEKYRNDKFFLLGISPDKAAKLENRFPGFLKKYNIKWPQTLDVNLFFKYNIFALSTSMLLDRQGRLVFIGHSDKVLSSVDSLRGKSLENAVIYLMKS